MKDTKISDRTLSPCCDCICMYFIVYVFNYISTYMLEEYVLEERGKALEDNEDIIILDSME